MISLMPLRSPAIISSLSLGPSLSSRVLLSFGSLTAASPRLPNPRRLSSSSTSLRYRRKKREAEGYGAKLEAEIYDFMERSEIPGAFPTREELIAAGREDLVEAIEKERGYLALGWDLERKDHPDADSYARLSDGTSDSEQKDDRNGASLSSDGSMDFERKDHQNRSSSSDGSMDLEQNNDQNRSSDGSMVEPAGIEGILCRLEKERSLSYSDGSAEKKVIGQKSKKKSTSKANGNPVGSTNRKSKPKSSDSHELVLHDSGVAHSQKETSADDCGITTAPTWKTWSLQRAGNSIMQFEAAEVIPSKKRCVSNDFKDINIVDENEVAQTMNVEESTGLHSKTKDVCHDQIHIYLKHLESELTSTLRSLRSTSKDSVSDKDQGSSLKELHMLSDELEFKQNEIMNAKDKLRSIRAKVAIQRGKMMIIEAQNVMDFQKKKFDAAQKAMCLLHSTCIVWATSASEVFLVGSFDGWTNERRMERSESGVFTLNLKLYPGRYEIKFIVDGMWMTDPLRPIVSNNGYNNNVLIIP